MIRRQKLRHKSGKASYIKEFCGFFTDEITLRKEFGKQALFL